MPYCHVKGDIPPFATLTVDPDDGPTNVDTAGENGTSSTSPSRATVPLAAEAGVTGTS